MRLSQSPRADIHYDCNHVTGSISRWTGKSAAKDELKKEPEKEAETLKTEIKQEIDEQEDKRAAKKTLEKTQIGQMAASVSFYPEEAGYKAANVQYRKGLNFFSYDQNLKNKVSKAHCGF